MEKRKKKDDRLPEINVEPWIEHEKQAMRANYEFSKDIIGFLKDRSAIQEIQAGESQKQVWIDQEGQRWVCAEHLSNQERWEVETAITFVNSFELREAEAELEGITNVRSKGLEKDGGRLAQFERNHSEKQVVSSMDIRDRRTNEGELER